MVYLDYNATTPLCDAAREAMEPYLSTEYGNPSSIHASGRRARAAIDDARDTLAGLLGAKAHELIFTGGGTESCNLAVIGLARALAESGRHVITSAVEHHAVLHAVEYLVRHEGFAATILPVDRDGRVAPEALEEAIRPDTILVSLMHGNNETGTLQPLEEFGAICARRGVMFHSDAVQTFGKLAGSPLVPGLGALSLTAHKFYGPKGSGALWLRAGQSIAPLAYGGAHENTRRAGTENVAAIAGLGAAAAFACAHAADEATRLAPLREALWAGIREVAPSAVRNTPAVGCLPNTLNVSFPGCDGESLLIGLDLEGICVSSGSACMVGSIQPSHVLLAAGLPPSLALATVRFSLGRLTTAGDIAAAVQALRHVLPRQNAMAA